MFLRSTRRKKNGKRHVYWNVVENKRLADGRTVQRQVLYLGDHDGRELLLTRYTQPEAELRLLLTQMKLVLPAQPPPKISAAAVPNATARSEDLLA
jgi:hypothetical protein